MKCKNWLLSLVVLSFAASQTDAGVFERDWKTPGDGLLTFDDANQREWLDVPQTMFPNFPFPATSLENKYQTVVGQTMMGGLFEGFTPANRADVITLAQSAGIDVNSTSPIVNGTVARHLVQLLGPTHVFPPDNSALTAGLLAELDPECNCRTTGFFLLTVRVRESVSSQLLEFLMIDPYR